MNNDKRLIEDYLPIEAISAEASREKSVRKGHISTLHLWWARRPLVACRAAVYGALVPAARFIPENGPDEKKRSLGRANSARFVKSLCQYPGSPRAIQEAQRHILEAHAARLTRELQESGTGVPPVKSQKHVRDGHATDEDHGQDARATHKPAWVDEFGFKGTTVTVDDITAGRAPRPRVLDMFAGGGAIPLEALRLGCEAYANDLNPVAHIIQLCTLVYPQKYGKPHLNARGMTGPKDKDGRAGFTVTEAWPLDTERKGRVIAMGTAALASSIFLVARKRDDDTKAGNYEEDVVPELAGIVRERVDTLWEMGISGADLVIACVGAGLRAFTKYARVEFANGEEVPAERFLTEVETVVLETILGKLSKKVGSKDGTSLAGVDPATRFYVLWRYTYGWTELDAGEAIIFANGTHVELDGQHSLTAGKHALLEKKKSKYHLRDFLERGEQCGTGVSPVKMLDQAANASAEHGQDARATIDDLHRLLWLVEKKPPLIPEFLNEAKPNLEQLRLVAQALAGPALKGGELADVSPTAEQSALGKLLANWNSVMVGKVATADKRAGQQQLGI